MEPESAPVNTNNQEKRDSIIKSAGSFIWELAKIIIIALVVVLPIRYFLFQPFIVKGESMFPNFQSGNYLIIDEISYRFSDVRRGDVVVFNYPKDESQRFIKRIIGLPGEIVEVKDGKVYVTTNGDTILLEETYLPSDFTTRGNVSITLQDGEYFVMGDNREFSYDSRSWGVMPEKDLIGKAFLRLFPINEIQYIQRPAY